MNKLITGVVVGLAMGACSAVSALDVSAGGGAVLGYDIIGQGVRADYDVYGSTVTHAIGVPMTMGGVYGFLDASVVEIGVGLGFGGGKFGSKWLVDGEEVTGYGQNTSYDFSAMTLGISVLGKYNIPVPDQEGMEIFPAIGVEYSLSLSAKDDDGDTYRNPKGEEAPGDFSQFFIKLGVGYDYALGEKMYLRVLALYGIGLPTKFCNDLEDAYSGVNLGWGIADYKAAITSNVTVKLGVGFKF